MFHNFHMMWMSRCVCYYHVSALLVWQAFCSWYTQTLNCMWTTRTADSNKTSVTAELPRAQLASLRPTTASPPLSSSKNTTILVRNQYFVAKTNGSKARPSWTPPLFALAPSPIRKIAHAWHADETKKCRYTRVATLWWQWRQHCLEFF